MAEGYGPGHDKGLGNWITVQRKRTNNGNGKMTSELQGPGLNGTDTRITNTRYQTEIEKTKQTENRNSPKPHQKPGNTIMIKLKCTNYNRNHHYGNDIYKILQINYDQIFNTNSMIKIVYEEKHKEFINSEIAKEKLKKMDLN